jgi:putative transposase
MDHEDPQGRIIKIDEALVKRELGDLVKDTVEETLNKMLDAEADELCNAARYERTDKRINSRAGHYERSLETKAGKVKLKVPKLRTIPFESAIIDRYKRRECSVEEALIEMYLAGVSVRRVEDITEALWGTRVSAGVVSKLNKQVYEKIEAWRTSPITGRYPYVYLDGIVLKRTWSDEIRNVSILVAFGVNEDGYREMLGAAEGAKEDRSGWGSFIESLKARGLQSPRLFISDKCRGLVSSLSDYYPEAQWQLSRSVSICRF